MKIILQKFDNGHISVSSGITVSHTGAIVVNEKTIEVQDIVARDYFTNPDRYFVDFGKGGIHAKPTTA